MDNLPVEIFHRIFDHLDIETIFFSIRPVCRLFRSIIQSYDRLDFHLKIISKTRFDVLCRFIPPQNIRSLTLQNNERIPDQISPFLRQVHLRQLTRLHSIDLDGIDEFQLNYLFKRISVDLLRSFSIQMNRTGQTTVNHLSTVVRQSNLRNLHLNIQNNRLSEISWPMNCSIECLTVHGDITFDNLVKIFSCSPQLHRLIIKDEFSWLNPNNVKVHSFPPLKSLVVENANLSVNELESFLLLSPSLVYLKLIGRCETFDGKRWKEFIQVNLPHLDQFQFDVVCHKMTEQTREDFQSILQSFRCSFWIEHKKWFVQCQWNPANSSDYELYSIPMCKSSFEIDFDWKKEMISTSDQRFETTNIDQITLRLGFFSIESILTSMNIPYFPNVTKLHLHFYFNGEISINSTNFLSKIINLSELIEVHLECDYLSLGDENLVCDILTQLGQSSKLSTLIIQSEFSPDSIYPYLKEICQTIPPKIKYLKIPIKTTKEIQFIVERCNQLIVLQFPWKHLIFSKEIVQWIENNLIGSIDPKSNQYDAIWIGKIKQTIQSNTKRIKFIQQEFQFPTSFI